MLPDIKTLKSFRGKLQSKNKYKKIRARMAEGRSEEYGFLHIPKTGGSSLGSFGKELAKRGHAFPVHFPHGWRAKEVLEAFPKLRLVFILRDPLERAVSGFNSRLRQGRPTYDNNWSVAEAAAFAHFPSAKAFLDALLAEDEYKRSAVKFAARRISHLRWNYGFYFKDPAFVREAADRFHLIGEIERMDDFVRALAGLAGAPPELAEELYARRHEAAVRPVKVLAGYSEDERARLRAHFAKEYAIYDALRGLAAGRRAA